MARTIPIIHLHDNLLVSIQVELSDTLVNELKDNLSEEIRRRHVSGLILELSGVDTFDSYIACAIRDVAHMGRLMGVQTVIAGLDTAAATILVEMGVRMDGMVTVSSLDAGIDLLTERARERKRDWSSLMETLGYASGGAPRSE
jgi:rsbT antagonist protein RsbS